MTPISNYAYSLLGELTQISGRRLLGRHMRVVAMLGLAVFGGLTACNNSSKPAASATPNSGDAATQPAIPVVVTAVRQGTMDVNLFALGTVTPLNTVVVHSFVDGQVMSIAFKEGQMVNAGDLLAKIDPRPFEVQLTLATGQLARDQALLDNAQADLERYKTLLTQDSISRQVVDTQESLVRQHKGAVLADQGSIDNAKLQLKHTDVIAPISGRVGLRQVGPGNMVRATDANGIVVITQLQPVGVVFTAPEDALPRVMKQLSAGRVPVDAYDRAQQERLGKGWLLATDNQIDAATGTIKIKAEFPNANGSLFANQFVNVRMSLETLSNATLVPSAAIQRGAAGTFVYVVKDDNTVSVTPVKVVSVQGETTATNTGVAIGAMVVVDGADRLRDGAKVEAVVRDAPLEASAKEARSGKKSHNRQAKAKQSKVKQSSAQGSLKWSRQLSMRSTT
jgi:membrane fusion protein, multidrug efflux system